VVTNGRQTVFRSDLGVDGRSRALDGGLGSPLFTHPTWVAVRCASMTVLAVVALVATDIEHRYALAVLLLLTALVQPVMVTLGFRDSVAITVATIDIVVANVLAVVVPEVWPATLLWVGCLVTWQTIVSPLRYTIPLVIVTLTASAVAASNAGGEWWWLAVVTQATVSAACVLYGRGLRTELAQEELELLATMSTAGAIIHRFDLDSGQLVQLHGDVEAITGYTREEWAELDHHTIIHPDDLPHYWIHPDTAIPNAIVDRVGRIRRKDGTWSWVRDVSRVSVDRRGRRWLRGFVIDVTDTEEARSAVERQARFDHVTGLPNRLALHEHLTELLGDTDTPIALLVIDLDRFKEVNDTLGHEAGDQVLREMAARLSAVVDRRGLLARLGGDEFAVVVPDVSVPDQVAPLIDLVNVAGARPFAVRGVSLASSMSIGVAIATTDRDRATLIRHADIAMYAAKRAATGHRFFDVSLERTSTMQLSLSAALPDAIARRQLELYFQPKFDLVDGGLVGAEGLVRWHHPDFGLLTPDAFLDLALLSDSASAFVTMVFEQAIRMIRHSCDLGMPLPIAVNVAIRTLRDVGFASALLDQLERHGVRPDLLTIEITENDVDRPSDDVIDTLNRLTDAGVVVSIDDFGTGHSSLERLRTLRVDELKIDRIFVDGIVRDLRDRQLVQTIIDLAARMEVPVVAEGVEREDQAELLAEMGCRVAQGYLFARALDTGDFVRLLEQHATRPTPQPSPGPRSPALAARSR
jgi:diguanylate cyclase (GGDEF)-like protein/PAS domain S-box-containing protein